MITSGLSKFFKTARKSKAKVDDRIKAFHSTDAEFDKFKNPQLGYHFGANADLSKRAAEKGGKFDTKETEYELNLKNPLVIEDAKLTPSGWTYHHLIDLLDEKKVINDDEFNKLYDYAEDLEAKVNRYEISDEEFANEIKVMFRDILAEKGYDGIKWWNDFDNSPTHEQLAKATWDASLNDGKGGYIVPGAQLDPDWSYIAFSNKQIEKAKPEYGSESFINDPQRAYTFEEGLQLQPPNRDARSDAAHTVRGQEGYLLSPYTEPKYDQATFEKYVQDYDKKFARENLMDYEGDKVRLERAMQGMIEDYPSQGLIDMMEGSKYTLERPMYISRNIGYRMNPPKPTDVDANNVYSAKMVDPNNPNFVDKMERDFDSYGMFGSMPYIIRLDKGTEVYHPSYNADSGEIVIKGSDIQDSQKFKLDEFLQMNPEDIKKGTDWFSSLGLMNNIA